MIRRFSRFWWRLLWLRLTRQIRWCSEQEYVDAFKDPVVNLPSGFGTMTLYKTGGRVPDDKEGV